MRQESEYVEKVGEDTDEMKMTGEEGGSEIEGGRGWVNGSKSEAGETIDRIWGIEMFVLPLRNRRLG